MLMMLWKWVAITVVIALASPNCSVDQEMAVRANNRALQGAIGKLVRAQKPLVHPLTDEAGMAWQILDDAIGYLSQRYLVPKN
jgi:hypothetical protein